MVLHHHSLVALWLLRPVDRRITNRLSLVDEDVVLQTVIVEVGLVAGALIILYRYAVAHVVLKSGLCLREAFDLIVIVALDRCIY